MIPGDKFNIDPSFDYSYKWSNSAVDSLPEKKSDTDCTFSEVVEKACEKLMDRQIKYSIKRIHEMEENLSAIERELDEFLGYKVKK